MKVVLDEPVAQMLWCIRMLREQKRTLTLEEVYQFQQGIYAYDRSTVETALNDIRRRGYHWDKTYLGVPDMCIVWTAPPETRN